MAYYRLEPFGADVDHTMQATALAQFANVHRDRKKHRKPFEAVDFMPGMQEEEEDPEDIQAALQSKMDTFFVGLAAARSAERRKNASTPVIQRRKQVKEASSDG